MREKRDYPFHELTCENCSGQMNYHEGIAHCPFCGSSFNLGERKRKAVQKKAQKRSHLRELLFRAFLTICIFVTFSFLVMELSMGYPTPGMIAGGQLVLFILGAVLHVFRRRIKGRWYLLPVVLGFVLWIPFFIFFEKAHNPSNADLAMDFPWSDVVLRDKLPEPDRTYGVLSVNAEDYLIMHLCNVSIGEFDDYVDLCIESGYNIDAREMNLSYEAYEEEGFYLSIFFHEDEKEMSIRLKAPEELEEISWPTEGPGSLLPPPKSTRGKLIWDEDRRFKICIGDMTYADFQEYIALCGQHGFDVDYSRTDRYYDAYNPEGHMLMLQYLGYDTIEIGIYLVGD